MGNSNSQSEKKKKEERIEKGIPEMQDHSSYVSSVDIINADPLIVVKDEQNIYDSFKRSVVLERQVSNLEVYRQDNIQMKASYQVNQSLKNSNFMDYQIGLVDNFGENQIKNMILNGLGLDLNKGSDNHFEGSSNDEDEQQEYIDKFLETDKMNPVSYIIVETVNRYKTEVDPQFDIDTRFPIVERIVDQNIILRDEEGTTYIGERNLNMEIDGVGKCVDSEGQVYKGFFHQGKKHDNGIEITNEYEIYDGEFLKGQRNGFGKLNGPIEYYEGGFCEGKRSGNAKQRISNGEYYEGKFLNDKRGGGKGILKLEGIFSFEGILSGNYSGQGTLVINRWGVYCGEVLNLRPHGFGKLKVEGHYVYEGWFSDSKFDGFGILYT